MDISKKGHIIEKKATNFLSKSISTDKIDLDLKLSPTEIKNGKALLNKLVKSINTKTICLFSLTTNDKYLPESNRIELCERIKREFVDMNIIEVFPIENSSKISSNKTTFYSNNIREIGAFIRNTSLFIGANDDIMHLIGSVQVPAIGLFSDRDKQKYVPYNECSLAVNTSYCSVNDIIKLIAQRIDC